MEIDFTFFLLCYVIEIEMGWTENLLNKNQ